MYFIKILFNPKVNKFEPIVEGLESGCCSTIDQEWETSLRRAFETGRLFSRNTWLAFAVRKLTGMAGHVKTWQDLTEYAKT
jgi:hypothetical protein